ncbi:MAG TPA: UDP-3-O-(3-hydroxymyristoyl)glucosamine N-acyltransferase [Gammaproteobacteria bacterium]|nr:UDP-3-O-(3-hydroxymyristoyl)glucosamine N-acyltransferase [Gammaproteobacteria bacterium]
MHAQLTELAELVGGKLVGDDQTINKVDTLQNACSGAISFLSNTKYRKYLTDTHASAVILHNSLLDECPVSSIVVDNPYLAFARISSHLNQKPAALPGIHPSAIIDPDAKISSSAWVGPGTVIEKNVVIGAGCFIGPCCIVQEHARVGDNSRLVANVVLCAYVEIGQRCIFHPGVVIGADGFGIANDQGVWVKVPQIGTVVIGDDVEIGANTTVDRGALENTVLGNGVKLDNQIQIGHNVCIGEHTVVVAGTGVAGSVKIGKHCAVGGGVGIAGHLEITDHVQLTGMSMVTKSILKPGIYSSGMTVAPNIEWKKNHVWLKRLGDTNKKIRDLQKQVRELMKPDE